MGDLYVKWNVNKYCIYVNATLVTSWRATSIRSGRPRTHLPINRRSCRCIPTDVCRRHHPLQRERNAIARGGLSTQFGRTSPVLQPFQNTHRARDSYLASFTRASSGWWTHSKFGVIYDANLLNTRVQTFNSYLFNNQSKLTPILSTTSDLASQTVTVSKAIDANDKVVDLHTVNSGYLYLWSQDNVSLERSSVLRAQQNLFTVDTSHKTYALVSNMEYGVVSDKTSVHADVSVFNPLSNVTSVYISAFDQSLNIGQLDEANIISSMEAPNEFEV